MKRSALKTAFLRTLQQPYFYVATLSIAAVMLLLTMSGRNPYPSVAEAMSAMSSTGNYLISFCIIPTLAASATYAIDQTQGMTAFWSLRCGTRRYAVSLFVTAVVFGFLSLFLGVLLFAGIKSCFIPLSRHVNSNAILFWDSLLATENPKPVLFVLATASEWALSGALMSGVAALTGSLVPSQLVVYATPSLVYLLSLFIPVPDSIPQFLDPALLIQKVYPQNGSSLVPYLEKWLMVVALCVLFGYFTQRNIVRRQQHE